MGQARRSLQSGIKSTILGMVVNIVLAATKGIAGVVGNSYALIADAIESVSDVLTSGIVLLGLKMAGKPADSNHPYGHGKFEPLAAGMVALMLLGAAIVIAVESIQEIRTPHHAPAGFTLVVLGCVIVVKELLFRRVVGVGEEIQSTVVKADAWHHRSDAVTSLAAFVGISIALLGGEGYESADDCAALIAAAIIVVNALLLLHKVLCELVDTAPSPDIARDIRAVASRVAGVQGTHKCHVRKVGFDHFVDLDILCDPQLTIREGHEIAHNVGEALHAALPLVTRVLVHVEPVDDYGRRSRDLYA